MLMVQKALREQRIADAVGIYRAARELWPEDDLFGARNIAVEDEFLELHAVFFTDLSEVNFLLKHLFCLPSWCCETA